MLKLIVGLGNPGSRYAATRHNMGFMALDAFAREHGVTLNRTGYQGLYGELRWSDGARVILLKPLTYMNLSGHSVAPLVQFYKIELAHILVVYDDLDLPTGRLRLREKGGAGGHNGMKSIIQELGTQAFARLKIGIDRPAPGWDVADWVLAPFSSDEAVVIDAAIANAAAAIGAFLTDGLLKAMTRYNG